MSCEKKTNYLQFQHIWKKTPSATRKKSMAALSGANKHRPRQFWRKRGWSLHVVGCPECPSKPSSRPMVVGLYSTPLRLVVCSFRSSCCSCLSPRQWAQLFVHWILPRIWDDDNLLKLESPTKIHGIKFPVLATKPVGSTFTTAWSLGRWWCSTARRSCFSISCRFLSRTFFLNAETGLVDNHIH